MCGIDDSADMVPVTASETQASSKTDSSHKTHPKLYWWDEVPEVLQFNPYVKSGYRAGALDACKEL